MIWEPLPTAYRGPPRWRWSPPWWISAYALIPTRPREGWIASGLSPASSAPRRPSAFLAFIPALKPRRAALVRLAGPGADLLLEVLRALPTGQVVPEAQDDSGAVYAPKLTRALSAVRWDRDVVTVHNQVRALQPWPGCTTYLGEQMLKITQARPMSLNPGSREPGTVLAVHDGGVVVACGQGALLLTGLQVPGKKPLPVAEFLRGFAIRAGDVLRS